MELLSATTVSPWLVAFSLNIAMGLVLILVYGAARSAMPEGRDRGASLLIGVLFGLSAIVSMNYPVQTPNGLSIDARTVFILVGSLFGGPVGAVICAAMAIPFRLSLGGPGAIAGVASILVTASFGAAIKWRYGNRVSDFNGYQLALIGFLKTVLIMMTVLVVQSVLNHPTLPPASAAAGFVMFPLGTALLGYAMGMSHQRRWSRTRQRLADIVETTTDVVWETDAEDRLTFLSDRHVDIAGAAVDDYLGKTPEALGSFWIDAETERVAMEAMAARKPYSNLRKRSTTADGTVKTILLSGRPRFDERGRFLGYRGTVHDITGQYLMEEELRKSRDRLVRAQRMGHIGSGEVDLVTGHVVWSDEMYAMMGFDQAGGAALERYLPHVHPDDRPSLQNWRQSNRDGQPTPPLEYRFIRHDGEVRWFHRESEVERDVHGRSIKLYTTQQDITERRRAEDHLRRILRAQKMTSSCNQLLIHARDEIQLFNDICCAICDIGGYSLAWIGEPQNDDAKSVKPIAAFGHRGSAAAGDYVAHVDVLWDENSARARGPMGRCIRSGRVVIERDTETARDFEPWRARAAAYGIRSTLVIPLKDGDSVFAALSICAKAADAFDAAEIEMMSQLGSDLTYGILGLRTRAARDEAQRQLAATRDAMRAIMDHTVDGLITINESGTILTFSRPAEEIFGYTAEEAINQNVSMLMPTPYSGEHDGYIMRYVLDGEAAIIGKGREVTGRRKDGMLFPMDLQVDEIPAEDGGRRFVGTVRDVTARKQTEAQLLQAQKMEAMGQLTGGVAHDFNNLLGVILGRLEMLETDLAHAPSQQAWARSCIRAVERGATLTKSLLAFARQQALMPIELDLNGILADMEDMMQRTLGEAFEFQAIKELNLWVTEADPGQLQNALLNLVINARDAMPDGGKVTVTTSNTRLDADYAAAHRDVRAGDYVLMSVSDTGIGMTRDVVERAFEPFYTTKRTGKGSGLGLSMVYGFVKQTGGHVVIYSEPGQGTNIRIYLPRKANPSLAKEEKKAAMRGGNELILVVEDNEDMRDLTRMQLQRLGYTVLEADNATDGLKVLTDHPEIRLLLTDVVLPHGVNGPRLAEQARATLPHLEVVFMSGYNEEHEEIEKARGGRPLRLLQKPFHIEALAVQLRAALDDAPAQAASLTPAD